EIAPSSNAPPIGAGLDALDISTNDFVLLAGDAKPQSTSTVYFAFYETNGISGLQFFTPGAAANILIKSYAAVALLKVTIPYNANVGDMYTMQTLYPSATSDAGNSAVPLTPLPPVTLLITNVPFIVGDSAGLYGAWYNAGQFGDTNLDNSDVNNAFYAASGIHVPFAYSDVFNSMDTWPVDDIGFVGGDGQIRYNDWVTILERALRLDPSNWGRAWSSGGDMTNFATVLVLHYNSPKGPSPTAPWYRQALIGATSVSSAVPGNQVTVPIYAKVANASSISGMQFRAVVTPQGAAPA